MGETRSLRGQVAVVTGGSSGMGADAAAGLAAEGMTVFSLSRTAGPGLARPIRCDVRSRAEVDAAVAQVLKAAGRIDAVVNAAGVSMPELRTTDAVDEELWLRIVETNLHGTFHVCRAVLPAMKAAGAGYIINIQSTGSFRALPGNGPYAVSKYGVRAVTETLAAELKGSGVRVTAVSPGPVDTAIWTHKIKPPSEEDRTRMLRPSDITEIVLFLLRLPDRVLIDNITVTPAFWK